MENKKKHSRQLAAIVFSDITGYTAMMQKDESASMVILERYQYCHQTESARFNGEIIQYYGDACLMTFQSAVEAVQCCEALQKSFREEPKVNVRIGIHLGDIVHTDDNIFGDAVNVASRVESMGIPGAVLFSASIQKSIKSHPELKYQSLGSFEFKNVNEPLEIFALANEGFPIPRKDQMKGKLKKTSEDPKSKLPLTKIIPTFIGLILLSFTGWYYIGAKDKEDTSGIAQSVSSQLEEPSKNLVSMAPFESGIFTDQRDSKQYRWIQYGNGQKWMAQNLDFAGEGSPCYGDKSSCEELGRLYRWDEAQVACPLGWHLPTEDEWNNLIELAGGNASGYATLIDKESSGFEAKIGGIKDEHGEYGYLGEGGNYWTSTISNFDPKESKRVIFSKGLDEIRVTTADQRFGQSCRCIEGMAEIQEVTSTANPSQSQPAPEKVDAPSSSNLPTASTPAATRTGEPKLAIGLISIEVMDERKGSYVPHEIQKSQISGVAGDLKIGGKSGASGQNNYEVYKTELPSVQSLYRVKVDGSGYVYNLSLKNGQNWQLIKQKNKPSDIDADLKIGARKASSTKSQSNSQNVSTPSNSSLDREKRLVIVSKSVLSEVALMDKLRNVNTDIQIQNALRELYKNKIASAEQAELTVKGKVLSYKLAQNDPDILPIIIEIAE